MKKLLSVILAIALSSFVITANAAAPDEEWRQSPPPTADASWGILAQGITQTYTMFAHPQLMSFKADKYEIGTGKVLTVKACNSFAESECPRDEFQKYGSPVGMCNADSSDCIEEVAATTATGEKLAVNFVKDFPGKTGWEFVGDKAANLPTSGSSFLVDVPKAPHSAGSLYLVSSIQLGILDCGIMVYLRMVYLMVDFGIMVISKEHGDKIVFKLNIYNMRCSK
jgi:hypothetical protein